MEKRAARALAAVAWVGLLAGPGPGSAAQPPCDPVAPHESLQARIDAAPEGARLCLLAGRHAGPVVVRRRLALEGPEDAVIAAAPAGTTLEVLAPGTELRGFTLDGSGGRHDLLDAALRVEADDVVVREVTVRNALFGILVEKSNRVRVTGCSVIGQPDKTLGLRGDAIRIWEVRDSEIEGNTIRDSRDLVVWYSPRNRIVGNVVERGRYGTHFMYSHDNEVRDNRYDRNVVGIFAMYSRGLQITGNEIRHSAGAAGVGLGAKESGNLHVADNRFVGNTTGVYLDTSPLDLADHNVFERNEFRLGETGIVFHSSVARNAFRHNTFRDNLAQVRVEGRGDALGAEWRGNHFDDYAGYDLDGDGTGDLPYEMRSLAEEWIARHPRLALFRGSPAMALVEVMGRVVPLFRPRLLLVDPEPRLRPERVEAPRAG